MKTIGLLIETDNGRIKTANLPMITALQADSRHLCALLVDADAQTARPMLAEYGISRIIAIATGHPGPIQQPAACAQAVVAAMQSHGIDTLVGLTSATGRELLPRMAATLDAPLVMDCIQIDPERQQAKTSQYSGKTLATFQLYGQYCIYGMRPNLVSAKPRATDCEIIPFDAPACPELPHQVIAVAPGQSDGPNLAEADVIVSGGRGMKNGDNFSYLHELARLLGASVGASRVAVDSGWAPYAMQVGQTGVKVNPRVYMAIGISGSIQHFAGMKTSKMIIAINSDENAAILSNCDYFAVGDLFDILPALIRQLKDVAALDA